MSVPSANRITESRHGSNRVTSSRDRHKERDMYSSSRQYQDNEVIMLDEPRELRHVKPPSRHSSQPTVPIVNAASPAADQNSFELGRVLSELRSSLVTDQSVVQQQFREAVNAQSAALQRERELIDLQRAALEQSKAELEALRATAKRPVPEPQPVIYGSHVTDVVQVPAQPQYVQQQYPTHQYVQQQPFEQMQQQAPIQLVDQQTLLPLETQDLVGAVVTGKVPQTKGAKSMLRKLYGKMNSSDYRGELFDQQGDSSPDVQVRKRTFPSKNVVDSPPATRPSQKKRAKMRAIHEREAAAVTSDIRPRSRGTGSPDRRRHRSSPRTSPLQHIAYPVMDDSPLSPDFHRQERYVHRQEYDFDRQEHGHMVHMQPNPALDDMYMQHHSVVDSDLVALQQRIIAEDRRQMPERRIYHPSDPRANRGRFDNARGRGRFASQAANRFSSQAANRFSSPATNRFSSAPVNRFSSPAAKRSRVPLNDGHRPKNPPKLSHSAEVVKRSVVSGSQPKSKGTESQPRRSSYIRPAPEAKVASTEANIGSDRRAYIRPAPEPLSSRRRYD